MPDWIGHGSIRAARRAPLFQYLKDKHSTDVILEGSSLRLACDHSVVVSDAYTGFLDYSTGESGNSVDCLTRYFDYDFIDAVIALCEYAGIPTDLQDETINVHALQGSQGTSAPMAPPPAPASRPKLLTAQPKPFTPPPPVQGPYRQLFAYLTRQRGIPSELIQELIDRKLLYQEAGHNNMVFINQARTYAEVRGTVSGTPFHGMVSGSAPEDFWWFKPGPPASPVTAAFICEAAIDAISLYLLRQRLSLPPGDNPMYCSIGGVSNQQRIDAVKSVMDSAGKPTVLAVDNDEAGEKCRERNPNCHTLVPRLKDWNADLLAIGNAG